MSGARCKWKGPWDFERELSFKVLNECSDVGRRKECLLHVDLMKVFGVSALLRRTFTLY